MNVNPRAYFVPIAVSVAACLAAFVGVLSSIDWGVYDFLLRIRPAPKENHSILLVDFDDASIDEIGTWPIGRDVVADGVIALAELDAAYLVFDIEYVDASPRGVDVRYLDETLPESFNEGFGSLSENIRGLFTALANKRIPLAEAESYIADLAGLTDSIRDELLDRVRLVAADNDERLGRAARFFGKTYFTVNMRKEKAKTRGLDADQLAVELAGTPFPEAGKALLPLAADIQPTIVPILSRSAGAGFPNVYVDPDGVRRRIDMFYEYDGRRYGQLAVAPLLDFLGSPEVRVSRSSFLLKTAHLPSGEVADIRVPRTEDGKVLIDWPHKGYLESFRHISFRELLLYERLLSDLAHNLKIRDDWGYLSLYDGSVPLARLAEVAETYRRSLFEDETVDQDARSRLRQLRDALVAETTRYLDTRPEDIILAQVDAALASGLLDAEQRAQYETIRADVPVYFEKTRTMATDLADLRKRLGAALSGSFCVVGWTSTGTTDIGVNPFAGEYVNVGTHAALLNTILGRSFMDDFPVWVSLIIAIVATFGLALLIAGRKPAESIGIGLAGTALLALAFTLIFAFSGRFVAPSLPIISVFVTFLVSTIISFLRTEREKGFLRNAFSHYLSNEVIKEIVSDPGKLKLGGTKRFMTAMFTDIRGFSTVSEKLTPEELVRLLNRYLSGMSDVILDLKGTIDKYEGDAIIAFFGAPLDLPDHASRACAAAIKMKRLEEELNEQFLSDGAAPSPLLTRLGINTGDMVVGNMGTDRKMDYTIIGDSVNLAARLEGVNKLYGTWICLSEDTKNAAGADFFFRRLDRIRVVGKDKPIRIFELVDFVADASAETKDFYDRFELALEVFEGKDWRASRDAFSALLSIRPDDGPSKLYRDRSETYITSPPSPNWDGVFNMTSK